MFEDDGTIKFETLSEYLQKHEPDSVENAIVSELIWFRAFAHAVAQKAAHRELDHQPLAALMETLFRCYDYDASHRVTPDGKTTEEIMREFMKQRYGAIFPEDETAGDG